MNIQPYLWDCHEHFFPNIVIGRPKILRLVCFPITRVTGNYQYMRWMAAAFTGARRWQGQPDTSRYILLSLPHPGIMSERWCLSSSWGPSQEYTPKRYWFRTHNFDQNEATMAILRGFEINADRSRMKIEWNIGHTRVQQLVISSNIDSNRTQRAVVYCGTVALVGSVLTRER